MIKSEFVSSATQPNRFNAKRTMVGKIIAIGLTLIAATMSAAKASPMSATFTGVVQTETNGLLAYDGLGYFGGGYLTGDAFTEIFVYDPSLGNRIVTPTSITVNSFDGFTLIGSPILSASLTINGHTYSFIPQQGYINLTYSEFFGGITSLTIDAFEQTGVSTPSSYNAQTSGTFSSHDFPLSLDEPFSSASPAFSQQTFFDFTYDQQHTFSRGGLVIQSLVIASVPEPSEMTLFIAGIVCVGAFVRRKKTLLVCAA